MLGARTAQTPWDPVHHHLPGDSHLSLKLEVVAGPITASSVAFHPLQVGNEGRWRTTTKQGMSVSAWTRGDCASLGRPSAVAKRGKAKVLDWLLWFLVPIGLFLALLVILGLKFLRDLARNERERGDDR
jgi:hypothetical protein